MLEIVIGFKKSCNVRTPESLGVGAERKGVKESHKRMRQRFLIINGFGFANVRKYKNVYQCHVT